MGRESQTWTVLRRRVAIEACRGGRARVDASGAGRSRTKRRSRPPAETARLRRSTDARGGGRARTVVHGRAERGAREAEAHGRAGQVGQRIRRSLRSRHRADLARDRVRRKTMISVRNTSRVSRREGVGGRADILARTQRTSRREKAEKTRIETSQVNHSFAAAAAFLRSRSASR